MKNLFFKALLPISLFYLLYFLIMDNWVFPNGNAKIARAKASYDHVKLYVASHVDYVVLGDSTALYGINPLKLTENSVSFSMIASSLYYAYHTLSSLNGIEIKKGILLSQTFISDHYDDYVWGLFVPADLYSFDDVKELYCPQVSNQCSFVEKAELSLKFIMAKGYLSSFSLNFLSERVKNYERKNIDYYKTFYKTCIKKKGYFDKTGFGLMTLSQFKAPYEENFSRPVKSIPLGERVYLKKLIELAGQKKIKIFFVILPLANLSKDYSDASYKTSINNFLDEQKGTTLKIIDLSKYESHLTQSDFWDYNHLNAKGAALVSQWLKLELSSHSSRP